ncbi:MAG: protein kinase [Acidobacteria bacterium]|nr:protein kinase [Acidobacteriota bacterium]MBU1474182.1 protein kinase [Acidobacteriota bacterium]MBU4255229.1 protein kinase [Acidobacteriota bacterium]MBU4494075.1 protein kinase [Acidobacteriota bacterium]MCG2814731.1 protein kinase [Candidatus Aminicenantes bacterium]
MGIKCFECQYENPEDTQFCGKCGTRFPKPGEAVSPHTQTLQTPVRDLLQGTTFAGRYRIIQELGRGGMGVVYKAQDTKLKRTVALKFLPHELTHIPEIKERFIREAQAAAALDHPNICTVYEFDEAEEKTFISMAYIDGRSLKKKIDSGPLEISEALKLAIQAAEGLQEAHRKGVVHRDIKSANIMVTDKGQAKIMDFGLARVSGTTLMTQEGMTMGTIAYMSPEQARGEGVDHRTDIWSFGVVLYEMFGGRLPFKGEFDQAVVYSILHENPKPVTDVRPEIPMSIGQVVAKALEKNRDKRYQSIDDLVEDLRSISEGIEPEGMRARLWKARIRRRKKVLVYAGIPGFLIIMLVFILILVPGRAQAIDAIAVLPLENLTGDAEQEFFVDAATDELIGQLAQIGALRVICRRSVMQYKGGEKSLSEIAKELKVDAVVDGTVYRVGDSVRIRVQLIKAFPEEQNLWAQTYDRAMTDVLVMYREMARAIADKIRVKLTAQEEASLASISQVNPEAYKAYTRGMFHFYKLTPQDLDTAMRYFELTLAKDPNYALAYTGIAFVWAGRQQQGLVPADEAGPKLKAACRKALELDDTLEEVHYTVAVEKMVSDWDWKGAEESFRRAIELNPNYPDPRAYFSWLLFYLGHPEEAMEQIQRALEMDPFNIFFKCLYAWDLIYLHRYDDAIENLREILDVAPTDPFTLGALKSAYHLKGMHEEALEMWRVSYVANGDSEAVDALARGFEEEGYSGALTRLAEMMIKRSRTTFVTPWRIGTMFTRAGKTDEAIEWLEKAYDAHDPNMPSVFVDPIFDGLRGDPRFQELLRKMNLPLGE